MLRVTSEVVEGASHWGKQKYFLNQDWSLQFSAVAVWKGCHLRHNHMNICGLQHFASVWKEILVSLRGLPQSPCFVNTWVAFSVSEIEIKLWTYRSASNTIAHTRYTHRGPCMRKWFHLQNQNQGWGLGDCFLKYEGANVQKFASVWKMSPHLNTVFDPFPRQFLPQPFRLMCLPLTNLTAQLPFFISLEKVEFLAFLHLRRN